MSGLSRTDAVGARAPCVASGVAPLTFGSVCSGIEAASVAWHPLGWRTAFVSEIDRHASAVLRYRYPDVPNLGDFTAWPFNSTQRRNLPWLYEQCSTLDVLVSGTPCQDFSVAGLRAGLAGARGGLALAFLRMARRLRPEWLVWENVPGVLSSNGGRDFGAFLGALGQLGYGFAYRVLDAIYTGVPQRRRRVFVVAHLGDWRRAAAVLFERESLSGHPPPSGQPGTGPAGFTETGISRWREGCRTLRGEGGSAGGGSETFVMAHGQAGAEIVRDGDPSLTCNHEAPIAFNWQSGGDCRQNLSASVPDALTCHQVPAVYQCHGGSVGPMGTLRAGNGSMTSGIPFFADPVPRRFMPVECERLQGFPDDWTARGDYGKGAVDMSDTQRYKMCGNSMAVPVMSFIGQRINYIRQLEAEIRNG